MPHGGAEKEIESAMVMAAKQCTHIFEDGFILAQCDHAQPVAQVLQQCAI